MFDYIVTYHIINGDEIIYKDKIVTIEDDINRNIRNEIIQEYLEDYHTYEFDELVIDNIVDIIDRSVDVEEFEYGGWLLS